jgi:hypothetical protein
VAVLRAGLARKQDQLLGAHALRVHIGEQLQALLLQRAQAEVGDLDVCGLVRREHDAGPIKVVTRAALRLVKLLPRNHGRVIPDRHGSL